MIRYGYRFSDMMQIIINIRKQQLIVYKDELVWAEFPVSTAKKGVGELRGSEGTPSGWHIIRAKIGANQPVNTLFINRRPVGIYSAKLRQYYKNHNWILTRILWLSGVELGKNRLGAVDTMQRCIYIHGAPDETIMGVPSSRGCVCMHNEDIVKLFNWVKVGTPVLIRE